MFMPVLECIRIIDTMCTDNRLIQTIYYIRIAIQPTKKWSFLVFEINVQHWWDQNPLCLAHVFPKGLFVQTLFWNTKAVASRRIWFNHPRTRPCGIANLYDSNAMQILCALKLRLEHLESIASPANGFLVLSCAHREETGHVPLSLEVWTKSALWAKKILFRVSSVAAWVCLLPP